MQKIHKKILELFDSKVSIKILYGIGAIIVLILSFSLGVSVGFHKASFGQAWGDNYEKNFGIIGNDGMMLNRPFPGKDNFPNAHGAVGKIIKIELPTLIVQDKDNTEKVVLLKSDTKIEKMRTEIKTSDLLVDDFIVVIGSPNDKGQIEAKFIRAMPSPGSLNTNEKSIQ